MVRAGVSHYRPIIPSNGNPTGKLRVRVCLRVGSGSNFRLGSGTGAGKHHRVRFVVEILDPHAPNLQPVYKSAITYSEAKKLHPLLSL